MNALPLLDGLADSERISLRLDAPAIVADRLLRGECDAGLVPAAVLLRDPGLMPLGQACIASQGPVDSVLILLRCAPRLVRQLSLDPESRTSQLLARWVLRRCHGAEFEAVERADGVPPFHAAEDAALVIGDKALHARRDGGPVLDLGAEWTRATGRPFVYAVWAVRRGWSGASELCGLLDAAAERGLANIEQHVREAARRLAIPREECAVYLRERIRYRLGSEELAGLSLFLEEARSLTQ